MRLASLRTPAPPAERWRAVLGWEGFYEVSDLGRVRSLDRVVTRRDGQERRWRGRSLAGLVDAQGYCQVSLSRPGRRCIRKVHRIVLEAFVGPRPPGLEGCHGNGDPADNQLTNLRWDTKSANALDSVRHGGHESARKTHCPRRHALLSPNLVAWHQKRGRRGCLACKRAHSAADKARAAGRPFDLQAEADRRYAEIMAAA